MPDTGIRRDGWAIPARSIYKKYHYFHNAHSYCRSYYNNPDDKVVDKFPVPKSKCDICFEKLKQARKMLGLKEQRKDVCIWLRFENTTQMRIFINKIMKIQPEPVTIHLRSIETWRDSL